MKGQASQTGNHRNAIQWGGPGPTNPVLYAGVNSQQIAVDGLSPQAEYGDRDTIWEPDPHGYRRFVAAGTTESPPDPGEASIIFGERLKGGVPRHLRRLGCFNLYMPVGECVDPSNLLQGWTEYVHVLGGARPSGALDLGTRSQFEESSRTQAELDIGFERYFVVGPLSFARAATGTLLNNRTIAGLTYQAGLGDCDDCGDVDSGLKRLYAVRQGVPAGVSPVAPDLIYSLDGGLTWTVYALTGLTSDDTVTAVESVGGLLVLAWEGAASGFYTVSLSDAGEPLTGSQTVIASAGFDTSLGIVNAQDVFLGAIGGVWRLSLDTGGALKVLDTGTDKATVSANDVGVMVTGPGGRLWISWDGLTFPEAEAPAGALAHSGGLLVSQSSWYLTVGTDLYFTNNRGSSYTLVADNYGSGLAMVCPEVLYYVGAGGSGLFSSWYGGALWTNRAPRVGALPAGVTLTAGVAPAVPFMPDLSLAVNTLALAGDASGDGVILLGSTRWL